MSHKTAVITGATQGIGKSIAQKFLAEGYDIGICARSQQALATLQSTWHERYPDRRIVIYAADFSRQEEVKSFAAFMLKELKHIDVLINNAGIFLPGTVIDEAEEQLSYMMEVNVMSAYHLSRAIIPSMKAHSAGHIINICSIAGLHAYAGGSSYSISKYAMLGLSDNLREACKPYGIGVTAICPGPTLSPSWDGSGVDEDKLIDAEDIATLAWQCTQLSAKACVDRIVVNPVRDM